ncbi:unnamed protein product, partial [marine sediment metagenome]
FYKDGKSIVLNTHPEVVKFHLDNKFKFIHSFPITPSYNKLVYCPKSADLYGIRSDSIEAVFNHREPIDFVEFHEGYFDFYCYASIKGPKCQSNFYMNNLEKLKFQNRYIQKQASNIIATAEDEHYFQIPELVDSRCFMHCQSYVPEKIRLANEFLQQHFNLS